MSSNFYERFNLLKKKVKSSTMDKDTYIKYLTKKINLVADIFTESSHEFHDYRTINGKMFYRITDNFASETISEMVEELIILTNTQIAMGIVTNYISDRNKINIDENTDVDFIMFTDGSVLHLSDNDEWHEVLHRAFGSDRWIPVERVRAHHMWG